MLEPTLEGAEKALDFFRRDYSATNMDALYGLRIGQGLVQAALTRCQSQKQCGAEVTSRLADVDRGVETTVEKALPYVQQANPQYFGHFLQWVSQPFIFPYTPATLGDVSNITSLGPLAEMFGMLSDECMSRVSGSYRDPELDRMVPKCNITDKCWQYMTQPGASSYRLTHDLIYFLTVERTGCQQQVADYLGHDFDFPRKRKELCRLIYVEANVITKGEVTFTNRDLLLEQVTMCGLVGYQDFMQHSWLKSALSWQSSEGCFQLPSVFREAATFLQSIATSLQRRQTEMARGPGRRLLTEQVMSDGCLAHMTTLGFSTLATFLRHLVERLPDSSPPPASPPSHA